MEITDRKLEALGTYPFADIQIGQCLEVSCDDIKAESSLRSAASYWGKRYKVTLTVRKISDGLFGVWRLA